MTAVYSSHTGFNQTIWAYLSNQLMAEVYPQVNTIPQQQFDATDKQINGVEYELFGLTEEEIEIVEERE